MSIDERVTGEGPNELARSLFAGLPDRYDRLCELLTLGQNRRWRRAMVDRVLAGLPPSRPDPRPGVSPGRPGPGGCEVQVLDVASGTAGVALQLVRRSGARVVGFDLSADMLAAGARNVAAAGAERRIALALGRAEQLPFPDAAFDGLTFTYLLRYVDDPAATLAELARVLRPGAPIASLDFAVPDRGIWRPAWRLYTRAVLPPAGWLSGGRAWWDVGRFLGPNISGFYRRHPTASIVADWHAAGIVDVGVRRMTLGSGMVMWGRRAGG